LILIEGHQGYAAIFDHLAITLSGGQFVFRKMRENFQHRPFLWRQFALEFFFGHAIDEPCNIAGAECSIAR
jgi:hypothetical protein